MPDGMVDIIELPFSWLSAESSDCIKGTCHLTFQYHKIELYELSDKEALGFMKDIQKCAKALKAVTNAIKINYEIHGNTIPHLHIHLILGIWMIHSLVNQLITEINQVRFMTMENLNPLLKK